MDGGDDAHGQLDLKPSTEHLMQMGLGYNRKMHDGKNLIILILIFSNFGFYFLYFIFVILYLLRYLKTQVSIISIYLHLYFTTLETQLLLENKLSI